MAWHTLATLAYLIERQASADAARAFLSDLLAWTRVAETTQHDALRALSLPMRDFEDALQAVAAQACGATYLITRNGRDFVQSPVPVLSPEQFLAQE